MQSQSSNILSSLATISKVPVKVFNILSDKAVLCIASAIHDAVIQHDETATIDVGIGQLSVRISDMQCKFIPSKELKNAIKQSITDNIDPLELSIENMFSAKLLELCEREI